MHPTANLVYVATCITVLAPASEKRCSKFQEPRLHGRKTIPITGFHVRNDTTSSYSVSNCGSDSDDMVTTTSHLLHWVHRSGCVDPLASKAVWPKNSGW
jgi:hypothetical protein